MLDAAVAAGVGKVVDTSAESLPSTARFQVFLRGEASEVRAVRRHLIADRRVDPDTSSISAYWRQRHSDEEWRKTKRQWMAAQAGDA